MYNPMYNNFFPYQTLGIQSAPQRGLLRGLTGGISKINWGTILNNTQKTLNVINQAIPVYYQIKPIYNNAKTMFRVVGAMSKDDNSSSNNNRSSANAKEIPSANEQKNISSNKPIFFI